MAPAAMRGLRSSHRCTVAAGLWVFVTMSGTVDAFFRAPPLTRHGSPHLCRVSGRKPSFVNGASPLQPESHLTKILAAGVDGTDVNDAKQGIDSAQTLPSFKALEESHGARTSVIEQDIAAEEDKATKRRRAPSLLAQMAESQPSTAIRENISPKDMAQMASMAAEASQEDFDYRRRQIALAIASPLFGAALFAAKKNAPKDPVAILREMERRSPPIQVALASGIPTVVEFYAKWCGDCKAMASSMEELEQVYGSGKVNFVVLDAEKDENAKLVGYFKVDAIPHFAFISADKTLLTTLTGYLPSKVMEKQLQAFSQGQQLPYCGVDMCGLDPKTTRMKAGSRE
eukprot:CAMPEP_0181326986 /NCGR_PEP_ID=MMETSP1101-20121128/21826_1 /TAXON_ID=46948 /ORGANISM="Rhodomonas abbreviata, Strain Caron Lab Isolate" /LENGTH=342 /DNA_ID=CAMNT_0023435547 /DNA_START=8 /DNA_END=1036 /DNA_ORIENTATION=-